jgi:hypothetical protein
MLSKVKLKSSKFRQISPASSTRNFNLSIIKYDFVFLVNQKKERLLPFLIRVTRGLATQAARRKANKITIVGERIGDQLK